MGTSFRDMGTSVVGGLLSGASGPLGALFGDRHGTAHFSFPSDVEGVGQRHFIRFNILKITGTTFERVESQSSISPDENGVGELVSGLTGAAVADAVGGGVGGALLGSIVGDIAGNASDALGVSSAVGSIVGGVESVASDVLGTVGGAADAISGGLDGVLGAAEGLAGGVIGAAGDLAGGLVGGVGDLLSGDLPSLSDINIELPNPLDALDNAYGSIKAAASETFGALSSAPGEILNAVTQTVDIAEDALKNLGGFLGSSGGEADSISDGVGGTSESVGDIILFMPFGVSESYGANWAGGELGAVGAAAESIGKVASAAGGAGNIMKGIGAGGKQILEEINQNALGAGMEIGGKLLGKALGNDAVAKKALQVAGLAVNPHWELFFEGVNPRSFTFDFKMSPKNATEAQAIQAICRTFKINAAPGTNKDSTRYWTYPHYFEIEYWNADQVHKIKPCALTQISINYTATGTNHTFYDGYPIQTDLSLTFMESVLLTRDDFTSGDDGGY
ncbi:MAG TPA: hypothetical protein EYO59_00045 [Chromatiaceae bacterium]|nr:hypothetical protein [Flavobacteriales bacterium]HIB83022.1 hypothetical protein [Chromatiaceae bacterium]